MVASNFGFNSLFAMLFNNEIALLILKYLLLDPFQRSPPDFVLSYGTISSTFLISPFSGVRTQVLASEPHPHVSPFFIIQNNFPAHRCDGLALAQAGLVFGWTQLVL